MYIEGYKQLKPEKTLLFTYLLAINVHRTTVSLLSLETATTPKVTISHRLDPKIYA